MSGSRKQTRMNIVAGFAFKSFTQKALDFRKEASPRFGGISLPVMYGGLVDAQLGRELSLQQPQLAPFEANLAAKGV